MVKVATVAKEVMGYLAERTDPMNFQGEEKAVEDAPEDTGEVRKASTGSVPDFAHQGDGVKIGSVIEGSAGEKAGLQAGDIIMEMDGTKLTGLRQYSDLLKKYQPGDVVKLVVDRNGETKEIELELGER
jgi:S1-C subfamily serine protease